MEETKMLTALIALYFNGFISNWCFFRRGLSGGRRFFAAILWPISAPILGALDNICDDIKKERGWP